MLLVCYACPYLNRQIVRINDYVMDAQDVWISYHTAFMLFTYALVVVQCVLHKDITM